MAERAAAADQIYASLGHPDKAAKADSGTARTEAWGAELDEVAGFLGFPLAQRASLVATAGAGKERQLSKPVAE